MDSMADKQDKLEGQGEGPTALAVRPTELDLALCEQICNRIAKGQTLRSICEEDWRWPTFQQALLWLSESADFAYWYSLALFEHEDRLSGKKFQWAEVNPTDLGVKSRTLNESGNSPEDADGVAACTEALAGITNSTHERPTEPDADLIAVICHLIATSSLSLQQICEDERFPTLQVALQWLSTNSDFVYRYSLALDSYLAKKQLDSERSLTEVASDALSRSRVAKKCGNTNALAVQIQAVAKELGPLLNQKAAAEGLSPLIGVAASHVEAALVAIIEQTDPITVAQIIIEEEG